jgi:hypothetical protein
MTSTPEGHDQRADEPAAAPRTRIPLDAASVGHLRIKRGLDGARITADPRLGDLLHGSRNQILPDNTGVPSAVMVNGAGLVSGESSAKPAIPRNLA